MSIEKYSREKKHFWLDSKKICLFLKNNTFKNLSSFHPLLTRREIAIDQWIGDNQSQSIQILMDAGRKGVNAAAQGALSGVGVLQTNAQSSGMTNASGVLGSIVSLASNAVNNVAASTPTTQDQDETFETIDESEIISSSGEEMDEDESSVDEDYQPRRTRASSKKKD